MDSFMPSGLWASQTLANLLGPLPSAGSSAHESFMTCIVEFHEGRTSIEESPVTLEIDLPKESPPITKRSDMKSKMNGGREKRLPVPLFIPATFSRKTIL